MKVINGTNILENGQVDTSTTGRFISPDEFHKKYSHFAIDEGDVVVSSSGTIGKVGRIKAEHLPLMMNTSVIRFRSNDPSRLDDNYLHAFLRSRFFLDQVRAVATGAAQSNFGPSHLNDMVISLPPLPQQRWIAGVLSTYDELIENSERRIRILEEMARALYREWFVEFRFPGHQHGRMSNRSGVTVPSGWDLVPMPTCVEINPRVSVPKETEVAFVPMAALANDCMLVTEFESRTAGGGSKFQNGDTLFARITPCLENGKTGFVQFLPSPEAVATGSTEFIVFRSRSLTPEFVYCLARSEEVRNAAIASMSGASGRQRVQEKCFDTIQVACPPRELLERFSAIAVPSFELIQNLFDQSQRLRKARDLLLPRLLAGASVAV